MKKIFLYATVFIFGMTISTMSFAEDAFEKDEGTGWNEYVNDDGSISQMNDMGEGQYMDGDQSEQQLDGGGDGGDFITNDGAPLQEEEE